MSAAASDVDFVKLIGADDQGRVVTSGTFIVEKQARYRFDDPDFLRRDEISGARLISQKDDFLEQSGRHERTLSLFVLDGE